MADSEAQPHHATDNPSKYYNHFFFKAIIVTLFLLLLPLFPSQAPDSVNQTLHTRSWEILQLVFVGIAVSYGLFSRKSDEIDKENGSSAAKFDNAQSYVSRLLQVSSVFDDESEDASVFDDNNNNNNSSSNKVIQTWSNQYHRGEPMLVVAKESHVLEEQRSVSVRSSKVGEKPLLLPVRSLKSRVAEPVEEEEEENRKSGAVNNRSESSLRKSMEDKAEENVVLPSPIPWRSRSGRMEMKEESKLFSSSSLMAEDPEFNKLEPRSFRSQSFRSSSSRPNSTSPSPNKLSPSPSPAFSSPKKPSPPPDSSQVRILEEMARKKTPAPPPPPPHFLGKSSSMKSSSLAKKNEDGSSEKELRRSIRSVPAEIPDEVVQNDATFPGKSARTFTPFNGRGRSYCIEKVKENLGKKDGGLVTEDSEDSEVDEDDFFDENAAMVGTNHSAIADDNCSEYNSGDGGPDVDKKADEFIAKFREQIRLQRIESIRRSAGQAAARNQLVR